MRASIPNIGSFYNTGIGQVFADILRQDIHPLLPHDPASRWAAIGFPFPILPHDKKLSPHCVCISGRLGGGVWPDTGGNRTLVMDEGDWPLASHSLDTLVILHSLEFTPDPDVLMAEAARVLVGQGTLIVVTANRRGFWASAEWSPWGHGQPFTANQMQELLHRNGLNITMHIPAMFVPPIRWRPIWRIARQIERAGRLLLPAFNGIHVFVAKKQTLSGIVIPATSRRGLQTGPARLSGAQASVQESA